MNFQFIKIVLRSIRFSFGKFLSIAVIVALGVGFYSGMKTTAPNMMHSFCEYLDDQNVYDLGVINNEGFSKSDIEELKKINNVNNVVPAFISDFIGGVGDKRTTIRAHAYDFANHDSAVNKIDMVEGSFPKSTNECVVSLESMNLDGIEIGSTIDIVYPASHHYNQFVVNSFKVVGFVHSPLCIDKTITGNTDIGDGQIYNSIFVNYDSFSPLMDCSFAYIVGKEMDFSNPEEYKNKLNSISSEIKHSNISSEDYRFVERTDNAGLNGYHEYINRTASIALPFPILFFIVAIIVVVATMSRKVNDERIEVGTLKAFGFSKLGITSLYLGYSITATLIGCLFGILILYNLIPSGIMGIYHQSYVISLKELQYYPDIISVAIIVFLLVVCLFTVLSVVSVIWLPCVSLMRPQIPKNGHHIILENIGWLWSRIDYITCVSLRNLISYPGRLLMSLVGIVGCVVLILSSVNLYATSSDMVNKQFHEITLENAMINVDYSQSAETEKSVTQTLNNTSNVKDYLAINQQAAIINNSKTNEDYYVFIQTANSFEELSKMRNFLDYKTGKDINLNQILSSNVSGQYENNGAIITNGLAESLNIDIGDDITLNTIGEYGQKSNDQYSVHVAAIVKNYIMNYIYLDSDSYKSVFQKNCIKDCYLLDINDEVDSTEISKDLFSNKNITYLKVYDKEVETYSEMVKSVYLIALILCIAAAILAFVVLFCIAEINISERIKEIATLKVLGFREIIANTYIHRETIFQYLLGLMLGLCIGTYFSQIVLDSVKGKTMMFEKAISFEVYLLVFVFSFIVVFASIIFLSRRTKKIDLANNLKSID